MNHDAIDAGADRLRARSTCPPAGTTAEDDQRWSTLEGRPELVSMVENVMDPVGTHGRRQPARVRLRRATPTAQFQQGAAAYEKRGVAVDVPEWDRRPTASSATSAPIVCPHATIRPFALTEEEAEQRPGRPCMCPPRARQGPGMSTVRHAVSPLDCMGCGVLRRRVPGQGQGAHDEAPWSQTPTSRTVFDYCVAKRRPTSPSSMDSDRQGQPVQAAPARVLRRLRRLRRDPLCQAWSPSCSATACTSPTPPAAPPSGAVRAATSPYTVNDDGHGPAWANSLFEDNAEHGLGMLPRPRGRAATSVVG